MSNTIQLKHSTTAGSKPATLAAGEIAVNTADKKIFITADGAITAGSMFKAGTMSAKPTLTVDTTNVGYYYIMDADDTASTPTFYIGDWFVSNGTTWDLIKMSPKHESDVIGGYAPLDANKKIPAKYISVEGGMIYKGTWSAKTNGTTTPHGTPDLSVATNYGDGWYYIVSEDGSADLDGITDWKVGDWAVYADSTAKWEKIDNTQESVTATQVAYTDTHAIGATNTQAAIDTLATGKQDAITAGAAGTVYKSDGTATSFTKQVDTDVNTDVLGSTGTLEAALTDINARSHAFSGTGAPAQALGSNGDIYSEYTVGSATAGKIHQKVDGSWVLVISGTTSSAFTDLSDTPGDYSGKAGQIVVVNTKSGSTVDGDELEFTNTIDGGTY